MYAKLKLRVFLVPLLFSASSVFFARSLESMVERTQQEAFSCPKGGFCELICSTVLHYMERSVASSRLLLSNSCASQPVTVTTAASMPAPGHSCTVYCWGSGSEVRQRCCGAVLHPQRPSSQGLGWAIRHLKHRRRCASPMPFEGPVSGTACQAGEQYHQSSAALCWADIELQVVDVFK